MKSRFSRKLKIKKGNTSYSVDALYERVSHCQSIMDKCKLFRICGSALALSETFVRAIDFISGSKR